MQGDSGAMTSKAPQWVTVAVTVPPASSPPVSSRIPQVYARADQIT